MESTKTSLLGEIVRQAHRTYVLKMRLRTKGDDTVTQAQATRDAITDAVSWALRTYRLTSFLNREDRADLEVQIGKGLRKALLEEDSAKAIARLQRRMIALGLLDPLCIARQGDPAINLL